MLRLANPEGDRVPPKFLTHTDLRRISSEQEKGICRVTRVPFAAFASMLRVIVNCMLCLFDH
jgi:hypothetical protein